MGRFVLHSAVLILAMVVVFAGLPGAARFSNEDADGRGLITPEAELGPGSRYDEPSSRGGRESREREQAVSEEQQGVVTPPSVALGASSVPAGAVAGQEPNAVAAAEVPYAPASASPKAPESLPQPNRDTSPPPSPAPPASSASSSPPPVSLDALSGKRAEKPAPVTTVKIVLEVDGNKSHWDFIQSAIDPAQASQLATGVPASATIGQAIHESAWGTSRLSREGKNYFGIKASGKPGTKGVITMGTWEHLAGKDVTVRDAFRAYNTMVESFVDHGRFFLENDRYAKAMKKVGDPKAFVQAIASAGYATDPNYARKVIAYIDRYELYQYDLRP